MFWDTCHRGGVERLRGSVLLVGVRLHAPPSVPGTTAHSGTLGPRVWEERGTQTERL